MTDRKDVERARKAAREWDWSTPESRERCILRVIEETRAKADERLKMSCPDCQAIAPENEKDWPDTECVVCTLRAENERLKAERDEVDAERDRLREALTRLIGAATEAHAAMQRLFIESGEPGCRGRDCPLHDALAAAEKVVKP